MQVLKGVNLRHLAGRHLKAAKLYQAFQGALTVGEIKSIAEFLSMKKQSRMDADDEAVVESGSDFIDIDDLIEAIQMKHDLDSQPPIQQSFGHQEQPGVNSASAAELESLQRKIGRILREKDDDAEFFSSKIR